MKKKAIYFKVFIYIPQKCNLRHQQKRNFIYDHFHFLIVGKFFHNLWNCFPFSISKADAAASSKCMHLYFDIPCFLLPQLYVVYYYCKRYQQSSFATGRTVVTVNCQEYLYLVHVYIEIWIYLDRKFNCCQNHSYIRSLIRNKSHKEMTASK